MIGTKQAGLGLNQAILAQVMGHTTVVTTMRYVAKVPDYQQKAMEAMQAGLAAVLRQKPAADEESPFTADAEAVPVLRLVASR